MAHRVVLQQRGNQSLLERSGLRWSLTRAAPVAIDQLRKKRALFCRDAERTSRWYAIDLDLGGEEAARSSR